MSEFPTISPLPDPPQRNEPESQFVSKANAWVAAQPNFRTQVNAAGEFVEVGAEQAGIARDQAQAARDAALEALPIYASVAAGLGATDSGEFFRVIDGKAVLIYLNDNGTAVQQALNSPSSRVIGTSPTQVPDNDAINSRGFAESVASVEALRGMTIPDSLERIWLEGYYGPGTPGGGPLRIDRDDTTSEDNGGTVFVTADGLRVKRVKGQGGSVHDFGARGDGVTDDTSAVQNAVNVLDYVEVPSGEYVLSDAISVGDSTVLAGAGYDSLFVSPADNFAAGIESGMLQFSGRGSLVSGIRVDLSFDSSGPTLIDDRSSGFAFLSGSADNKLQHCWAHNVTQHGVLFLGENNHASNITVKNANRYFISFGLGTVAPNITKNCSLDGLWAEACFNSAAIEVNDGVNGITVRNCVLKDAPQGILIHDHSRPEENNYNIVIDNIIATEINGSLVTITAAEVESLQFNTIKISNCDMEAVPGIIAYGIDIQGNVNAVSGDVFFHNCAFKAIRTLRIRDVNNVTFSNVTFDSYEDAETLAGGSISVVQTVSRVQDLQFSGCMFNRSPRALMNIETGGYENLSFTDCTFREFAYESAGNAIACVPGIAPANNLSVVACRFYGGASASLGIRLRENDMVTIVGCHHTGLGIGLFLGDDATNLEAVANVPPEA